MFIRMDRKGLSGWHMNNAQRIWLAAVLVVTSGLLAFTVLEWDVRSENEQGLPILFVYQPKIPPWEWNWEGRTPPTVGAVYRDRVDLYGLFARRNWEQDYAAAITLGGISPFSSWLRPASFSLTETDNWHRQTGTPAQAHGERSAACGCFHTASICRKPAMIQRKRSPATKTAIGGPKTKASEGCIILSSAVARSMAGNLAAQSFIF
jgi:hypothetical protein